VILEVGEGSLLGEFLVGQGGAGGFVDFVEGGLDPFDLTDHFEVEHGGLHGPETAETPFGGSHALDEEEFGVVIRLEAREKRLEELVEESRVLIGEEAAACFSVRMVLHLDKKIEAADARPLNYEGRMLRRWAGCK